VAVSLTFRNAVSTAYALYSRAPRTLPWGTIARIPLWLLFSGDHIKAVLDFCMAEEFVSRFISPQLTLVAFGRL